MNLISWKDFLVAFPALTLVAGGIFIVIFQVVLPRYRAFISYLITILSLFVALAYLVISLGWLDIMTLPVSFKGEGIHGATNFIAFQGHFILGRYEALYSFAIILFACFIILMGKKVLMSLNLNLVEAYQMMLFSTAGLVFFICSNNLIMLFLSLELSSLPTFVLAGWDRKSKSANEAGIKYFLLSAFSVSFLLLGIAFVYGACGSTDLSVISRLYDKSPAFIHTYYMAGGLSLILVGLMFKAALFPLHAWVADVYEGSITVATNFMAALVKIASVGVIFKILISFSGFILYGLTPAEKERWELLFLILAVGSMFYGNITALVQTNLKRLFSYSSIAHAGYMASLFWLACQPEYRQEASIALFFYVFSYAAASTLVFGTISYLEILHDSTKNIQKSSDELLLIEETKELNPLNQLNQSNDHHKIITLENLKGFSQTNPIASFLLSAASLSFAGIPPLIGFYGKFYILKVLITAKMYPLAFFVSINSLIAVFYYARILFYSYWYSEESKVSSSPTLFLGFGSKISVALISLTLFTLGIISVRFMI